MFASLSVLTVIFHIEVISWIFGVAMTAFFTATVIFSGEEGTWYSPVVIMVLSLHDSLI